MRDDSPVNSGYKDPLPPDKDPRSAWRTVPGHWGFMCVAVIIGVLAGMGVFHGKAEPIAIVALCLVMAIVAFVADKRKKN
jgi:hypothetical protein